MRMPSTTAILLNGAAALVAVASVVTLGRSIIGADQLVTCRERYTNALQWPLQRENGELYTSFDLQARLGSTDWGLIERVSVVRADNPGKSALMFDLTRPDKAGEARSTSTAAPAGAGFEWLPRSINGSRAGCASFTVRFEPEFAFNSGGRLPGIRGGRTSEDRNGPNAFSTRLAWTSDGHLNIHAQMPGLASSRGVANERGQVTIPRGRWITVDQEVVLNTPGRSDGIVRVWLDGSLAIENRSVNFRTDEESGIRGLLAEVAYGRQPLQSDPKGQVSLAQFEFRW